ncbi:MAG: helix-turn-helix domain-containing protein [Halobacteriota archaeon]
MAKYSTGRSGGGDDGDACELCGQTSSNLQRTNVAGAELLVCPSCAPHGEQPRRKTSQRSRADSRSDDGPSRKKRAAQRTAKMYDASRGDSSHWEEEGTNYERDRLPYLVSGYGDVVETARQAGGYTVDELADELDVDEETILAVEQGRATRAGVGGSVIRAIEAALDVDLVDE